MSPSQGKPRPLTVHSGDPAGPEPTLEHVRGASTAFTDIVSVSAARGVAILLALASVTLVTHLLTPRQYSILAYITVISNLMFTAISAWTSTALTRYGREELEKDGSLRATSWSRLLIIAPLVAVATVVITLLKLAGVLPDELSWAVVAIAVATGLGAIAGDHVVGLLEAAGRMKLTAIALSSNRIFSITGIGVLAAVGAAHSPIAIALAWLAVSVGLASVLAAAVWRVGMWPPRLDRQLVRRMVVFSFPLIAFAVSQYVIGAVDVILLSAYRSSREVGIYALAYQGYGMLQQVATTATIVLSPLFVSLHLAAKRDIIRRFYARLVPQTLLITSIVAGSMAALVRLVVPVIFGRSFSRTADPFALLLIAWVLYAAASFVAPIIVLHERARAIGAINFVGAGVNVVGDWILLGPFGAGIWAPAVATAAALVVIAAGYFWVAANCIGEAVIWPAVMLAPAAAGVACAILLRGWTAAVAGVIASVLGGAVVQLFARPFEASDAELIEKLDIPSAGKRWALAAIQRAG